MKLTILGKAFSFLVMIILIIMIVPLSATALITHSGTIGTETWGPPDTHYVDGSVTVSDGHVLTIQPGTVIKFAPNTQMTVYGTLSAPGTGEGTGNSIVFTSRNDNSIGETVAGSNGTPAPGNWYGIYLNGTGDLKGIGEFSYCVFRYGGYSGATIDANVLFYDSYSGFMTNCISEYSHQHGVRIQNCSPLIADNTLHDNVLSGLYASGNGEPTITGNTFTANNQYAAHINLTAITPLISNNTGSGNKINALAFDGNVTANQTWASTPGFPIVLLSSVTVNDDVQLTIAAGTVIKFSASRQLYVQGTLIAHGSEGNRIVFTSLKDDSYDGDTNGDGAGSTPAPGNWYGIYLNGTGDLEGIGEFSYCVFRYGGYSGATIDANVLFYDSYSGFMTNCISEYSHQHGVRIQNCSPLIADNTLHDNVLSGLYASAGGTPTITDNTFTDNGQYAAHLNLTAISPLISGNTGSGNQINALAFDGNVTADQTWTSTPGFPIVLLSSVTVNDDVQLTIAAGTVIKFSASRQLYVQGTLIAHGSEGNRIVFTSLKDDSYDGDTNGDGAGSTPAPGNWYGIYLNGTGDLEGIGEFSYCVFRYGGYSGATIDANVLFYDSYSGFMTNCISEYSHQHGVRIQNCSPLIADNTLHDNVLSGLYASAGGTPTITDNTFTDNGQYAAHLNLTAISPLISGNTGSGNQINALAFDGNVTADQTWTSTPGFPIVLLSSVTVNDDVQLTIAAGTVIKFSASRQLYVQGTLIAHGSEGNRIVFTSLKDDSYGGDTNGDGAGSTPAPGNWYGIYLNGTGDLEGIGEFSYCVFRYGGYSGATIDANVLFYDSYSGFMTNCISEYSHQHGVRIQNCSPLIANSTLSNNTLYGLNVLSGTPKVVNSIVWGNTAGGISGTPVVAYSDIQGGYAGEGNIDEDPLFLDPDGDYRLDICSPAIDAGDPVEILTADYNYGEVAINVNSVTAVENDDTIWITDGDNSEPDEVFGTTGTTVTIYNGYMNSYTVANRSYLYTATSDYQNESEPTGLRINMGAYGGGSEATHSIVCRGDLVGNDHDVDGGDLDIFKKGYGLSTGDPDFNPAADVNRDGTVDHNDLFMFAAEFGRTDCPACL